MLVEVFVILLHYMHPKLSLDGCRNFTLQFLYINKIIETSVSYLS